MTEPWFDPLRFGALYGGIGGGVVGALGGTLGALTGWLAPKGKARSQIVGGFVVMLALGVIHLVAGLFALISGQPYGIWYPLVLLGAVMTIVFGALLPTVRRRYQDAEMRRIQAAALRRT